jgi:hypothetical protein
VEASEDVVVLVGDEPGDDTCASPGADGDGDAEQGDAVGVRDAERCEAGAGDSERDRTRGATRGDAVGWPVAGAPGGGSRGESASGSECG